MKMSQTNLIFNFIKTKLSFQKIVKTIQRLQNVKYIGIYLYFLLSLGGSIEPSQKIAPTPGPRDYPSINLYQIKYVYLCLYFKV